MAGIIVPLDGGAIQYWSTLIELAVKHRLPAIYGDTTIVNFAPTG